MKPRHIAIILDGNRRFAKKQGLEAWKGHEFGAKTVESLIKWAVELKLKALTIYAFSTENFNRSKIEIEKIMGLFARFFAKLMDDEKLEKHSIKINFIGNKSLFSEEIQKSMRAMEEKTKSNSNLAVNFAIGYGGRAEIVDAAKRIAEKAKAGEIAVSSITEESFLKELYLKEEPDMIIRSGGELRLSNFLPYQSTYSELYFIEKLWPEITKEDLIKAMEEFESRERRQGR
ncbi:MAG: polyprenyl diphosphate synthase [Nanoarchaeota archaeon]|nr:polyprenyl diphosphate synthase [Nanoarchaeota archaeon]